MMEESGLQGNGVVSFPRAALGAASNPVCVFAPGVVAALPSHNPRVLMHDNLCTDEQFFSVTIPDAVA